MSKFLPRLLFLISACVGVFLFITNFSTPPPQKPNEGSIPVVQEVVPSYVYLIFIDPMFSNIEKDIIIRGIYDWQAKTNGIIQYYIVGTNQKFPFTPESKIIFRSIMFNRARENTPIIAFIDAVLHSDILGYFDETNLSHADIPAVFLVPDRIGSYDEYDSVVRHEFAHTTGLLHSKHKHTLMWRASEGGSSEITQYDIHMFCQVYHCDDETMLGSASEPQWYMCYDRPVLNGDAGTR